MICPPCRKGAHDECPAAGAQPDLFVFAPLERVKTAFPSTKTRCDCQHKPRSTDN